VNRGTEFLLKFVSVLSVASCKKSERVEGRVSSEERRGIHFFSSSETFKYVWVELEFKTAPIVKYQAGYIHASLARRKVA